MSVKDCEINMATFIFDVDDTLYNQMIPFRNAFYQIIGEVSKDQIDRLYRLNREKSDELFEQSETGELPKKDMQVMRIQHACEQEKMAISQEKALAFQKAYEKEQKKIELYPEMEELMTKLKQQGHHLALLTNGAVAHQQKKIDQLGLAKWIAEDQMYISGALGKMKPDVAAFELVESALNQTNDRPIYIGDSFENDVVGAKRAGWHAIWLNVRQNEPTDLSIQPDKIVEHPLELLTLFEEKGYFNEADH